MPKPRSHLAEASIVPQVRGAPLVVIAICVEAAVSTSTRNRPPSATMRSRFTAPASIKARRVFSFIAAAPEQFRLFRDRDPGALAMPADKQFDQVGNAAMLVQGRDPSCLLDCRIDAEVESAGLLGGH